MSSFQNLNHRNGFNCYFFGEIDVDSAELWKYLLRYLAENGIASSHYTLASGLGCRRPFRDPSKPMNSEEILKEIEVDDTNSFWVRSIKSTGKIQDAHDIVDAIVYFPTPMDGGFQTFNISWRVEGFSKVNLDELVCKLSEMGNVSLAHSFNPLYNGWQNCTDPATYQKMYGPIDGYSLIERGSFPHRYQWLDDSKNPGRGRLNAPLPQRAEAEMWLGLDFWQYAECTKEEVLAADFFLEIRDTPQFLYLKSWPHPFTRPDGEQGRIQQKLWKLLFHEDCEWPPGSGGISDEAVYGPPELMP